jgi:hypothetical protein
MNWFWHAIFIALVVIPVTILWLGCVFDIFRRDDLHAASQILWLLTVLVLPVVGALAYLVLRPRGAGVFAEKSLDELSLSQQLSDLDRLHSTGALDDREFRLAKQDALARVPGQRGATGESSSETSTTQTVG